jgi:hypothetical protein
MELIQDEDKKRAVSKTILNVRNRGVAGSSLDEVDFLFSIYLISPAALWLWGGLSYTDRY